jgi:hypothetical protein
VTFLTKEIAKRLLKVWAPGSLILGALTACGVNQEAPSNLEFRPYDAASHNIFYIVGAPNGLPGVATDVREMSTLLGDQSLGYGWTVQTNGNATKQDILTSMRQYAAEVGENGSIGFFVSGHGSSSGKFMTADGMLGFDEVAAAVSAGRASPLRRLLTFNDSCYSGHWVNGNGALDEYEGKTRTWLGDGEVREPDEFVTLTPEQMTHAAEQMVEKMNAGFATVAGMQNGIEQFVTVAASNRSNTSLDLGRTRGGAFTYSLRTVFAELRRSDENATIGTLTSETAEYTWNLTHHHRPVYRASPETMLNEFLFKDGSAKD